MYSKILCFTLVAIISSITLASRFQLPTTHQLSQLADGLRGAFGIGLNLRSVDFSASNQVTIILGKESTRTRLILGLDQGRALFLEVNQQGFEGSIPLFNTGRDLGYPHLSYLRTSGNINLRKEGSDIYLRVGSVVKHDTMELQTFKLPETKVNLPLGQQDEIVSGYFTKASEATSNLNETIVLNIIIRDKKTGVYTQVSGRIGLLESTGKIVILSPTKQVISDSTRLDLRLVKAEKID